MAIMIISLREAAAKLGVHPNTLRQRARRGTAPMPHKIGHGRTSTQVFYRHEFEEYVRVLKARLI